VDFATKAGGRCADGLPRFGDRKSGAGGGSRTLTGLLSPADFLTVYGFRRPDLLVLEIPCPVCGLDYPFTLPR
jgi:hypothetical protein